MSALVLTLAIVLSFASTCISIFSVNFNKLDLCHTRHGFNKQTLGFFVTDQLKKFVVSQAIQVDIVDCAFLIP